MLTFALALLAVLGAAIVAAVGVGAFIILVGLIVGWRETLQRLLLPHACDESTPDRIRLVARLPFGKTYSLFEVPLDEPAWVTLTVNYLAVWRLNPGLTVGYVVGSQWGPEPSHTRLSRSFERNARALEVVRGAFRQAVNNPNLHLDIDLDTWEQGVLSADVRAQDKAAWAAVWAEADPELSNERYDALRQAIKDRERPFRMPWEIEEEALQAAARDVRA